MSDCVAACPVKPAASSLERRPASRNRQVSVVAFRSGVTDSIGTAVGFPVAVLAATTDPDAHARRLVDAEYAAWVAAPRGHPTPFRLESLDASAVAYTVLRMEEGWIGNRPLPDGVALVDGALRLTLPAGCTAHELGQLFALAMSDARFDSTARLPSEVRRRHGAGRPPSIPPRYSLSVGPHRRTFTVVDHLYRFRRQDLPQVASAAALAREGLMIRSELASPTRPPSTLERSAD